MTQIQGKNAVITGGASGIGFSAAVQLGKRGCRLVLADIEQSALDNAVNQLRAAGVQVDGVRCDVASFDDVQDFASSAFDLLGEVHIVFNNAGVAVAGPIADATHEEWRWVMDVNLWGQIHGVEAFLPRLIKQGKGGHLIFTSSFAGLFPPEYAGIYTVTKYGIVAMGEVLHKELQQYNIGVSILCPMLVATNIERSERNRQDQYGQGRSYTRPEVDPVLVRQTLPVEGVVALTLDAVEHDRLYVLTHEAESRPLIRRRFEEIDRTFDNQPALESIISK